MTSVSPLPSHLVWKASGVIPSTVPLINGEKFMFLELNYFIRVSLCSLVKITLSISNGHRGLYLIDCLGFAN